MPKPLVGEGQGEGPYARKRGQEWRDRRTVREARRHHVDQSESSPDRDNIKTLVRHLGLAGADDVLEIVMRYYPRNLIRPKTQFGIEEIMDLAGEDRP